jgi:hypothetical protein
VNAVILSISGECSATQTQTKNCQLPSYAWLVDAPVWMRISVTSATIFDGVIS